MKIKARLMTFGDGGNVIWNVDGNCYEVRVVLQDEAGHTLYAPVRFTADDMLTRAELEKKAKP